MLGHFTQPDTIVPEVSNSQSGNRYSYVRNNPVFYTDPTGHFVTREEAGGGGMGMVGPALGLGMGYAAVTALNSPAGRQTVAAVEAAVNQAVREVERSVSAMTDEGQEKEAATDGTEIGVGDGVQPNDSAASRVPDLSDKNLDEAIEELEKAGCEHHSTTKGDYIRYHHPDRSDIWIRPNGQVTRVPPKVWVYNEKGHPTHKAPPNETGRVDHNGNAVDRDNPEFINH